MSRSHPLLSQFSHASRRTLAWLATLALAVVGVVAVGAPATAAEADAIYSPGSRNAPSTVSGAVFVDREGMPSWINGQDQLLNGVTVYAYWQDEDGAISPTYYDVTRTIDGEDGQYSINVKPWTDANGKTHYFNAAGERLRVWSDNPDPALYSPAYMDSLGGMGTFFEHDASFWGYQVDGVGGGYVNNWLLSYQDVIPPQLHEPEAEQVESTATGTNANLRGTLSGSVFWEQEHTWLLSPTPFPSNTSGDLPAAGYRVQASYLTDAAVDIFDAYKAQNNPTLEQFGAWQAEQLAAHPEYIAPRRSTTSRTPKAGTTSSSRAP